LECWRVIPGIKKKVRAGGGGRREQSNQPDGHDVLGKKLKGQWAGERHENLSKKKVTRSPRSGKNSKTRRTGKKHKRFLNSQSNPLG